MKFLFAWRYFKSTKTTNAINVIAWISVVAIAVGSAALLVVLSVFNGFEGLVKSLYGDFYADVRVGAAKGKFITLSPQQITQIKNAKGVANISLTAEEKAVLVNGDYNTIVYLRGVDTDYTAVANVKKHISNGKYALGTVDNPSVVLGGGVENALAASPFSTEPLTIYLPNTEAESFNDLTDAMNSFNISTAGTFRIQEDFDNKYALTNIAFVKYMLNMADNQFSSVEIGLGAGASPESVQKNLQNILGDSYLVQTRYQQNQGLFSVMQMEKWVIYAILTLILLIAAFNMVGALTMLVLEKQKDIAVLKAMGANETFIQGIFLNEGILLGSIGGIVGLGLALGVCYLQQRYHLIKLTGGSFLIDYYPVEIKIGDFILVGITIFVIAILASYVPARKASTQLYSLKS